ncbi:Hypothetical protein HVR_LOCUS173 [uncultured virus]|nr:Hypothetical protein HVR_LOCUS173 [uncultured virus]
MFHNELQMGRNSYYLNIPLTEWDQYYKHIIVGIYNIHEGEYSVVGQHNGIRKIEFYTNSQYPLINSMPTTTISADRIVYYSDQGILDRVTLILRNTIKDYIQPGGSYYIDSSRIKVNESDLPKIIKQLTRNGVISKFVELPGIRFLVYVEPHPVTLLIKVNMRQLVINIYDLARSTFDVDDGYWGILSPLNDQWKKWKEIGDITVPIQSSNIV